LELAFLLEVGCERQRLYIHDVVTESTRRRLDPAQVDVEVEMWRKVTHDRIGDDFWRPFKDLLPEYRQEHLPGVLEVLSRRP